MKKLIVFSVIFTILAGAVFAQVTVKGGLGGEFVPFQFVSIQDNTKVGGTKELPNEDTSYMGMGFGRNGGSQQQGIFSIQGASENKKAGFRYDLRFRFDGSGTASTVMDGWGGVWFQPAPIFRIDAGRFNIDSYRGKIGDNWLAKYTAPMKGNNEIFNRLEGKDAVLFTLTPADGFALAFMINNMVDLADISEAGGNAATSGAYAIWGPSKNNKALFKYALEDIQITASYTIPDLGQVRAQYVGAHPSATITMNATNTAPTAVTINAQRIEAAFNLTAVQNLNLDIGGKYWFTVKDSFALPTTFGAKDPAEDTTTYQKPIQLSLGAVYKADAITINGRVDGYFGAYVEPKGAKKMEFGPDVWVYLWPTYALSSELTLGLDIGFNIAGEAKYDGETLMTGGTAYGFGASVRYQIGNGSFIRAGLAYSGGTVFSWTNTKDDAKKQNGVFSIPIGFEVSL